MPNRIVKPERRQLERRPSRLAALGEALPESPWSDRRSQCWTLEAECTEEWRRRCPAYFVRRNCWDLWATEFFPAGRRPCCHADRECSSCAVAAAKFHGDITVYVDTPQRSATRASGTAYCQHLYNSRDSQAISRVQTEVRGEFKCRRRPGIMLHETYVTDVCSCLEHRDCVFYEAE